MVNTVPTERNGITNVIFNLLRGMDGSGLTVDLVSIREPEPRYRQEIESRGGKVFVIGRSMKGVFSYIRSLSRVVREGRYDAVHAHGNSATLAFELVAAKLGGCRVRIAHSHNTTCKFMTLHRLLKPLFHGCCTHALACGEAAGRWLFGSRGFTVINNGVEPERFAFSREARERLRRRYGIRQEQTVIGHVGQLSPVKNQSFLLDVLKEMDGETVLLLIGDGESRRELEQKAARLELTQRVIFAGSTDAVPEHLAACDRIAMPSLYEGLPLSLIEEQASGLRCLVCDCITTEVDKTGNVTFLPLEAGAARWAQELAQELPGTREERSETAIRRIRDSGYDIRTEAEKLRRFYIKAVEE